MPASRVEFLTVDEALAIHTAVISEFGGPDGLRDPGQLESALFRPRTGYYRDLAEMAAALFESLLMNHPFLDGNKRVAFFATDVFLRLNDHCLRVDADEAHRFLTRSIEEGQCNFETLLPWIRKSIVQL